MPRALALVPDLMFGSRLQGSLRESDVALELVGDAQAVRERLRTGADAAAPDAAAPDLGAGEREGHGGREPVGVLVIDLTDADLGGAAVLEALRAEGALAGVRTIGFYSHVDAAARERAQQAGFDVVVPRSRMAREAAELIGAHGG